MQMNSFYSFKGRFVGLLVLVFLVWKASAQNPAFKEVSIASPNAAALGKYGDIPVNKHTGIPQINIPLYNVQEGSISLPISLSYHAGGLKVMEPASWVGAGWSLNAGGVITRTMMGAPDERLTSPNHADQTKGYFSEFGYPSYLWQGLNASDGILLKDIYSGKADGEPDLFFFNFGAYSGKFYFGDDRVPVVLPEQDFKIDYVYTPGLFKSIESFVITVPDGTKYFFGTTAEPSDTDPIERSLAYNSVSGYASNGRSISSWYLNKIQSADGLSEVRLSYQVETYSYFTVSMSSVEEGNTISDGCTLTKVIVEGVRLSKISFSNGTVNLIPSLTARQDLSGPIWGIQDDANQQAMPLAEINITDSVNACKKLVFAYDYFVDNTSSAPLLFGSNTVTSDQKRLKLLSVQEQACDGTVSVPPHVFDYYSELVPRKLSYAQDHWGFYNGASNPTTLIPTYYRNEFVEVAGANRDAKWPEMRGGSLKKITYPTGGTSEFDYEANTTWVSYPAYNKTSVLSFSIGFGNAASSDSRSYTFSTNPYKITLRSTAGGGLASVYLECTGTFLNANPGETTTLTTRVPPGACTITLSKSDLYNGAGAELIMEELIPYQVAKNEVVGGLRIKSVKTSNGIPEQDMVTNYSYDLSYNGHSSGILYSKPTYVQVLKNSGPRYHYSTLFYNGATWYLDAEVSMPLEYPYFSAGGRKAIKSAAPILPLSTTQGNHIGYSEVKVWQTGQGYSVYEYYGSDIWDLDVRDVCTRTIDLASSNPSAPEFPAAPIPFEYKRGTLKHESHWNEQGTLLRDVLYLPVYQNLQVTTPGVRVYTEVRSDLLTVSAKTDFELQSAKKTQETIVETVYDPSTSNNIQTTKTTLFESAFHNEPTTQKVTNSKGEELATKTKYAFDFRAAGCSTTNTCWTDYQAALQANLNTYQTDYGQCTTDDCRKKTKAVYLGQNMLARKNYSNCRVQSVASYNSCFLAALGGAGSELKPVLELQKLYTNAPLEVSQWRNSNLLGATFTRYDYVASPAGMVYPGKVLTLKLAAPSATFASSSVSGTSLTRDSRYKDEATLKYDQGNLVEVIKADGMTNTYIYGYKGKYPVAKVLGAAYATVNPVLNQTTLNNPGNTASGDAALRSALHTIRTSFPAAFASTYTYSPLVGMTSETDANGRTLYYEYDKLGRLLIVRDKDNNILKKFCYTYQGQMDCTGQ